MQKALRRTDDGSLADFAGVIRAIVLRSGSDAATVLVYDNPSGASGDILADMASLANNSAILSAVSIPFSQGLYVDISGTAPAVTIYVE